MARKRRLESYLNKRKQNPEAALEDGTRLSNLLFRLSIGAVLTLTLVFLAPSGDPDVQTATFGLGIFIFLATGLAALCLNRIHPRVFEKPAAFNQFVVLSLVFLGTYLCFKAARWPFFLLPLPLFAMIFAMVFSQGTALVISVCFSIYVGLISPWQGGGNVELLEAASSPAPWGAASLAIVLSLGAVTAVLGVQRVRTQSQPFIVGVYAGTVQALVLLCFVLMKTPIDLSASWPNWLGHLESPGWGLAGGVLSGAILTCLLPGIEKMLGILTERRLLDLADPSNELLHVLMEQAPGTYQHTLGVSNLASSAAEAIGSDSLLARVGAYYHDVGKIKMPQYYVENMGEDKSIHDRLRPSISKMIIISHVKEGILLAKDEALPDKIVDMIPMHHGTTVVEYFYHKARRSRECPEEGAPGEVEYRYPGPRPRFREAGILMLADSVEARAKVESHPNPNRFRVMVHEEIQKPLLDGQLDESDLTLNDLRVIEDSFVRTLTTMYHGRIKYPGAGGSGDSTPGSSRGGAAEKDRDAGRTDRDGAGGHRSNGAGKSGGGPGNAGDGGGDATSASAADGQKSSRAPARVGAKSV